MHLPLGSRRKAAPQQRLHRASAVQWYTTDHFRLTQLHSFKGLQSGQPYAAAHAWHRPRSGQGSHAGQLAAWTLHLVFASNHHDRYGRACRACLWARRTGTPGQADSAADPPRILFSCSCQRKSGSSSGASKAQGGCGHSPAVSALLLQADGRCNAGFASGSALILCISSWT